MYRRILSYSLTVVLGAGLVASRGLTATAADEKIEIDIQSIPADVLNKLPVTDKTLIDDTQPGQGQVAAPGYWLGIGVEPVADVLRAHLALPEGVGLAIRQVLPNSPAAKAALQVHDVLIDADGVSLKTQSDLLDAVAKAQATKMRLNLLRRGDDMTVEVTPEKRPGRELVVEAESDFEFPGIEELEGDGRKALQEWLQEMQQEGAGNARPFNFRMFGPELKMRFGGDVVIPENVRIQIQRSGQAAAKIQVQRGDESWDITEDQLDQLPPDIRGHVQRMLGGGVQLELPHVRDLPTFRKPMGIPGLDGPLKPDGLPKIQERLDRMNERMEQLFERLEDLRQPREDEPPHEDDNAR